MTQGAPKRRPVMGQDNTRFAPFRYWGRCVTCRVVIGANTEAEWFKLRRGPCPGCGRENW